MVTHYVLVRVQTHAGETTTQAIVEEIASNLQSVDELGLTPGVSVVAAVVDENDRVRDVLKRNTLLVTF